MLAEELTPFATLNAIGFPEGSLGSVARYLGLLATLTGDYDDAVRWFDEALIRNEKNGALPWVAHTHFEWAQVLILRGGPGDEATAETHLRSALELCDQVGLVALRESVQAALTSFTGDASPEAVPEAASNPASPTFRREGEYFSIVFDGAGFKLKDSKGLRYLRLLLGSPGKEIHVLDLVGAEHGVDPSSRGVVTDIRETQGVGDLSTPLIDRAARAAYEGRLADLQDEIAEAELFGDDERAESARTEHDLLVRELATSLGLGGRDRAAASAAERARVNVTRAIRSSVAKIDSHNPFLGLHLDTTIRTGVFCSYNPDPLHPFNWNT
jgi:tetratricopeptide (TPR) repeat protein